MAGDRLHLVPLQTGRVQTQWQDIILLRTVSRAAGRGGGRWAAPSAPGLGTPWPPTAWAGPCRRWRVHGGSCTLKLWIARSLMPFERLKLVLL